MIRIINVQIIVSTMDVANMNATTNVIATVTVTFDFHLIISNG